VVYQNKITLTTNYWVTYDGTYAVVTKRYRRCWVDSGGHLYISNCQNSDNFTWFLVLWS